MRWTALELLGATSPHFTSATDAWAFGITMYEAFTWGALPYANIPNNNNGNCQVCLAYLILQQLLYMGDGQL